MQKTESIPSFREEKAMSGTFIAPKRFELTKDYLTFDRIRKTFRIRALIDFGYIEADELGGHIEAEANLSQIGNAWIGNGAKVFGNAWVGGNAQVSGNAWVFDDACVLDSAKVFGNVLVSDYAQVSGDAQISGRVLVSEYAKVSGNVKVFGSAQVSGCAKVSGNAKVFGHARVFGSAQVFDNARVSDCAWVSGDTRLFGRAHVSGKARVTSNKDLVWFSDIGGGHSTLTVYRTWHELEVTHLGFCGTIEAFLKIISKRHGNSIIAEEYRRLIEVAQSHLQADNSLKEAVL